MSLLDFDAKPDLYAVMGNPIAHSKSPRIHAMFARQTHQHIDYTAILVEHGGLAQAVGNFQGSGGKGLNITLPFKEDAWDLMDERSTRAELAGAVNTIVLRDDGSRYGDNTDGVGLVRDLHNHGIALAKRRILILGAGGAVRGVIAPLLAEHPAEVVIANRTVERARELATRFGSAGVVHAVGYDALPGKQFDLVINGTSASIQGELPPLPDDLLAAGASAYDMMYGAQPTVFMRWAEARGAKALDGLGMLVEQAAESFHLWRGVRPLTTPVIATLRSELTPA